ncbi:MAG: PHP domain-containing protein [Myxococcota bacterium]|nr:PHP domain-containing protein [Myxococcota bacterium]
MLKELFADLHLHTALSPCAEEEMTPVAIVEQALAVGLQLLAICDHNTAGNTAAVQEAAAGRLGVIAGMEITTAEEAHVVGLFPSAAHAQAAAAEVLATLPLATAVDLRFGEQLLLQADGTVCGREPHALAQATSFTVDATVALIHRHAGLAVAAHLDRPSYSVLSQLGLFPTEAGFDAVEVSAAGRETKRDRLALLGLPLVTSSDSHFLSDVGICHTALWVAEPTFAELARALRGDGGRRCSVA